MLQTWIERPTRDQYCDVYFTTATGGKIHALQGELRGDMVWLTPPLAGLHCLSVDLLLSVDHPGGLITRGEWASLHLAHTPGLLPVQLERLRVIAQINAPGGSA